MGGRPTVRRTLLEGRGGQEAVDDLFRNLRLPNGTRKTTWARRFADLDELVLAHLPAPSAPLRVLDVAVSSGVSTIELLDSLRAGGHEVRLTATDLVVGGELRRVAPGVWLFADDDGHDLQWDVFGRGVRARPDRPPARALVAALGALTRVVESIGPAGPRTRVELVDPRLKEVADVRREDLSAPDPALDGPYELVRACNILNLDYFDDAQLRSLLVVLGRRLTEGGLLVVARTMEDGHNNGSLYRRRGDHLRAEAHLAVPADVDALDVASLTLTAPRAG